MLICKLGNSSTSGKDGKNLEFTIFNDDCGSGSLNSLGLLTQSVKDDTSNNDEFSGSKKETTSNKDHHDNDDNENDESEDSSWDHPDLDASSTVLKNFSRKYCQQESDIGSELSVSYSEGTNDNHCSDKSACSKISPENAEEANVTYLNR